MKTTLRSCAMALAIAAFLASAFNARAQTTPPPNQTTANGTVMVTLSQVGDTNDSLNGEVAGGNGNGTYAVTDPTNATGNANATGTATGSNTGVVVSSNGTTLTANGNAKSNIATSVTGAGANTNVSMNAAADQVTWSGTTTDPNATTFSYASQFTSGGFVSNGSGNGTVSQNGVGAASGESTVTTINVGGINVTSEFKTDGLSTATITATSTDPTAVQQISAVVSGALTATGASLAGDPTTGNFGDAAANGTASYNETNDGTAIGAGEVAGKTNSAINSNNPNQKSISVSATVTSKGQTK